MALSKPPAFRFVWLIGLVSLFADMTCQGAHANAGPYLAFVGASGTVVGVVAGAGELVNYTLRLVFGYWADRTRAYWAIAFPGYLLNLVAVPGAGLARPLPTPAAGLVLPRARQGTRTPAPPLVDSPAPRPLSRGAGARVPATV